MIILVIFALALIIFSFLKPKWAFYLLLALIPFHAFLFTTFNELLNFWLKKILFIKIYKKN